MKGMRKQWGHTTPNECNAKTFQLQLLSKCTHHSLKSVFTMSFPSFHFPTLTYHQSYYHFLLYLHFPSLITFLTFFLKLFKLQEVVSRASAGSLFQSWVVLFTKEYFLISVLYFLLLIFLSRYVLEIIPYNLNTFTIACPCCESTPRKFCRPIYFTVHGY
jgi:hypothetical protein